MKASMVLLAAVAVSCGGAPVAPAVTSFEYTYALTKAQCPVLPTDPVIHARLVAAECDPSAPVNNDPLVIGINCGGTGEVKLLSKCDTLAVTINSNSGAMTVSGDCPDIPARNVQLALQWYVISPTLHKEIYLAEQTGHLDLSKSKSQVRIIDFGAATPGPTTSGTATDSEAIRNRFNCDRTGVSSCDSDATPAAVTSDVDGCSNLEELCLNPSHLFVASATADSCP